MESSSFNSGRSKRVGTRPFAGDWSVQLIVGDKRVNVTMRAKDAMIVIIALKGEEPHKAGLPMLLYSNL